MMDKFVLARAEKAGKAMESDMNTVELQRILGYLNIGLAIAHDSGVSIGHFGCGDFIQLAQTVNGMLLHSIAPAAVIGSGCAAVAGSSSAPAGTVFAV
jgi:NifU-like protein involved in Fe-S cluster formation